MNQQPDKKVFPGVVHWRGSVGDFITDARDVLGDHWLDLVREMTDKRLDELADTLLGMRYRENGYLPNEFRGARGTHHGSRTDDAPTGAAEEAVILERQLEHARAAGNEQLVHLLEDLKLRRARAVAATRIPDPKTQRTYLCDYRSGSELVMIDDRAGGGDFYIGSRPVGDRALLNAVTICSSGGAAEKAPRLFRAMAWLWDAMGQDVPEVEAEARQARAMLLALVRERPDGLMPNLDLGRGGFVRLPSTGVLEFAALCHKLVLDGEIVVGDDWRMRIPSPTADPDDLDEWPTTGGGVARRKRADSFRNSLLVYFEKGDVDAAMRVFHIDWTGEWVVRVDGQRIVSGTGPVKTWSEAADRARSWRNTLAFTQAPIATRSVITIEPYRGP